MVHFHNAEMSADHHLVHVYLNIAAAPLTADPNAPSTPTVLTTELALMKNVLIRVQGLVDLMQIAGYKIIFQYVLVSIIMLVIRLIDAC